MLRDIFNINSIANKTAAHQAKLLIAAGSESDLLRDMLASINERPKNAPRN
jgi:hypothetical protein